MQNTAKSYSEFLHFIFSANKTPKKHKNKTKSSKRLCQWIIVWSSCHANPIINDIWNVQFIESWMCVLKYDYFRTLNLYTTVYGVTVWRGVYYMPSRETKQHERANKWENHKNIEFFCCCCGGFHSKRFGFDFVISAKKKLCSRPLHLHSISDNFFYFCGLEFGVDYRIFEVWNISFRCTCPQLLFKFFFLRQRTLLNLHYIRNWRINGNGNGYEKMGKHTNLILKLKILRSSE